MKGYDIGDNAAVIKMASLHITGNIIDLKWFKHLKLKNGKPDSLGILLLSDITYWYRPIEIRDEESGLVIGNRKKFAADKLQRSYDAFAIAYGYTKEQVKDALKRLEDAKVIDLDFRNPVINDVKYGNVLYIGLNVDRLLEISTPLSTLIPIPLSTLIPIPMDFKVDTNTEITTETKKDSENQNNVLAAPPKPKNEITNAQAYLVATVLAEVTGLSYKIDNAILYKEARALLKDSRINAELIRNIYSEGGAWYKNDWRGKQGQMPGLFDIRKTFISLNSASDKPKIIVVDPFDRGNKRQVIKVDPFDRSEG